MTTLPQTTSIRLPRPTGSTQLAVPTAPPHGVASGGPAFQMTGADVWRVIRANLWLIALFVIAGTIGGYYLNGYLERHYSTYTATGIARILPLQSMDIAHPLQSTMDNQSLVIEQKTDAHLIQSDGTFFAILNQAENPIRDTNCSRSPATVSRPRRASCSARSCRLSRCSIRS